MSTGTTSPFGSPAALRRFIAGQERAARVARQVDVVPTPEEAFDAAMDLWSLCPDLRHAPPDGVRIREIEQVRVAWRKLKERSGR